MIFLCQPFPIFVALRQVPGRDVQAGPDDDGPVGVHSDVGGGAVQARDGGQVLERAPRQGDGGGAFIASLAAVCSSRNNPRLLHLSSHLSLFIP